MPPRGQRPHPTVAIAKPTARQTKRAMGDSPRCACVDFPPRFLTYRKSIPPTTVCPWNASFFDLRRSSRLKQAARTACSSRYRALGNTDDGVGVSIASSKSVAASRVLPSNEIEGASVCRVLRGGFARVYARVRRFLFFAFTPSPVCPKLLSESEKRVKAFALLISHRVLPFARAR